MLEQYQPKYGFKNLNANTYNLFEGQKYVEARNKKADSTIISEIQTSEELRNVKVLLMYKLDKSYNSVNPNTKAS